MAVPGKILIDLGSKRLLDMSYTSGADIYLGDVSSQVYEFLDTPRPCASHAHAVAWQEDANYLFWTLGEVAGQRGRSHGGGRPRARGASAL